MKMYGYHLTLPSYDAAAPTLEKEVQGAIEFLAPLGINYLIIEITNRFQFQSHPEINEGNITAEQLSACCDRLRAAGIEPVPLYNCYGHQGWNSRNGLLKAYPEFDETPHIPDDKLIAKEHIWDGEKWLSTYTPAWCGNEPRVWDIVFPAIDEIVEAMQCKYVHLGMDEIFLFGQCDRCRGMTPAELFRNNVLKMYDHLKEKGIGVMLWGDRLLNAVKILGEEKGKNRSYDFETIGVSDCIDELPKDIIVCDWHYGVEEAYPSASELFSHDYPTWPSCWYEGDAAEAFWKDTLRQAKELGREDLLPGILVTGWEMRSTYEIFTLPESELKEKELKLKKTFYRTSELMQEYFN